jgi:Ca-activated chloride channel family protein
MGGMRRIRRWGAGLAGLAAAVGAAADPSWAQASEPAGAMIVFDGSGSMWGKLDGERATKLVNARDGIRAALGKVRAETKFGLVSFGHRRGSDCNDVQTLLPVEGAEDVAERLMPPLEKLNPRGKGPMVAALKEAARGLGKGPGRRSLILIHDDPDNCGQDPCAALGELQGAAPGLVVHAIGLGLKEGEAQRLQCLTKPTNGLWFDARTAAQVSSAIEDVLKASSLGIAPARPAAVPAVARTGDPASGALVPALVPRPHLATSGPPALRLAVLIATGQAPQARPVRWTVKPETENAGPTRRAIGQDTVIALPAGRYVVEADDGLLRAERPVAVAASGHTALDVVADAGLVRVVPPAGGWPADAFVTLAEASAGTGTTGKTVAVRALAGLGPTFAVPAGRWTMGFDLGGMRWEQTMAIAPGSQTDLGPLLPFARLTVTVAGGDATAAELPVIEVVEDDPDAPRGRREVARASGTGATLTVPAGTYAVLVRQGAVEARERLALQAGESQSRTLSLAGARLAISSHLAGDGVSPADEPVTYRIERIDVSPHRTYSANRATPDLLLPQGRYRIEARHGLVNARTIKEVDLVAGQRLAVSFEHQAGLVLLQPPSGHQGEIFWEILDASGRALWGTAQPTPRATLQAGRYTVRADTRERRYERSFEMRAGQTMPVQIKD